MKIVIGLLIAVSCLLSWGCAFNESSDDNNRRENRAIQEKYRVLRDNYNRVTGLYQGTLKLVNGDVRDVSIGIYTLDVPEGSNSSGEKIFKPILKALYKQLSPVDIPVIMDVQYMPEPGELSFVSSGDTKSIDALNTISAKIDRNNSITGTAKKSSGILGELQLNFITKDVNTDPEGGDNEYYRTLRAQYQKIKGTYAGSILREANNREPRREWKVELGIYIIDIKYGNDPNGEPKFRPVLKARFKQLSPVAPNVLLDAQFVPESGRLVFSATPSSGTGVGTDLLNLINAELKNDTIIGTASKASGYWGNLALSLTSREVDTPSFGDQEDYNNRLMEEYQKIAGNYEGKISPVGLEAFDFELKIFIVQVSGDNSMAPKLRGYYKRKSDKYNVTELTMDIDYKTELTPAGIDMSGQRSNGSLTYYVVLNGTITGGSITGVYHEQRGQQGPFRLKKVSSSRF